MKMRALYFSKAENAESVMKAVAADQNCHCDKIPPAYPCEREALVFICVEADKDVADEKVTALVKDLNTERTKNVAFILVSSNGSTAAINSLKDMVTKNGIGVVGETLVLPAKKGLFKQGKLEDGAVDKAKKWAKDIVASMQD